MPEFHILHVSGDHAELTPAATLSDFGTYATSERLQAQFGRDFAVLWIGQAGTHLLSGAGIACTGEGEQRGNMAARGGLGAVMGSKGLKAIVIDKAEGHPFPWRMRTSSAPRPNVLPKNSLGIPSWAPKEAPISTGPPRSSHDERGIGSLPTRNFSDGRFEMAETLRGEHLRELILARGGSIGTRCMPGCVIACRNVFVDSGKTPIVGTRSTRRSPWWDRTSAWAIWTRWRSSTSCATISASTRSRPARPLAWPSRPGWPGSAILNPSVNCWSKSARGP